jgi:predicted transposase/invertase (TIGR01784 family)
MLVSIGVSFVKYSSILRQYQPIQDWQAVIVFAKRIIEPDFPHQYRGLLPQLHRVYLDELTINPNQAIGVNIAELVIANEDVAIEAAKFLITQTRQQIDDSGFQQIVLDLVKAVLVYKLGKDKEQELKIMFTKEDMKKAWLVQEFMEEAKLEGKAEGVQETVRRVAVNMLKMGIASEQVSAATGLTVEQVQKLLK